MNTSAKGGVFTYWDDPQSKFRCRFCDKSVNGLSNEENNYLTLTDRDGYDGTYLICPREQCRIIALLGKDEIIERATY